MSSIRQHVVTALCLFAAAMPRPAAAQLRILLTNDDGYQSPGIQAVRRALIDAKYDVTVLAPNGEQSGRSSAITTSAANGIPLVRHEAGVWSLLGTPVDCIQVGLDILMRDHPPDLVISGANFGANLGRPSSLVSGTIGAALHAAVHDIPAIAVSIGIDLEESRERFPSTRAAFEPAAAFVVRLVRELEAARTGLALLPPGTVLNVNVPVPYDSIRGVRVSALAPLATFDIIWSTLGTPIDADTLLVRPRFAVLPPPTDPAIDHDVAAFHRDFITLSLIGTDLSRPDADGARLRSRLQRLAP